MPDQIGIDVHHVEDRIGLVVEIHYRNRTIVCHDVEPLWWNALTEAQQHAWADALWRDRLLTDAFNSVLQ